MDLFLPFSKHKCTKCKKYEWRIKELEELSHLHRRLNGELRETIAELTGVIEKFGGYPYDG